MWRVLLVAGGTLAAVAVSTSTLRAQDLIYTHASKDRSAARGTIQKESPRGVTLAGTKEEIAAEDIHDILYEIKPVSVMLKVVRPGLEKEKEIAKAKTAADRVKVAGQAIALLEQAIKEIKGDPPFPRRHLEFKVASLLAFQARENSDAKTQDLAIDKLIQFKKNHAQSWQLSRVLLMLAQLQEEKKDLDQVAKTYQELARSNVSPPVKQQAELAGVLLLVQSGKAAQAEPQLIALLARLAPNSKEERATKLALAECLAAIKKIQDAKLLIDGMLKGNPDNNLRAAAYNTLGYCYYLNQQWQEARWQFLWVDVIYNQDKKEHARALYYLADIFARLGEGDRSRDLAETLRSDPRFAGQEYQNRLMRDEKAPGP